MKRVYILVLFITLSFALLSQESLKVLFVGNSYTYVNDLPAIITKLAQSNNKTILATSYTSGGARFMTHWQNENLKQEIKNGNYDIMILQGQSQEVAFPPSQLQTEVYPYAQKLDSLFKVYNHEGRVIFFMTWGYKYGDANNCPFYPPFCTYESMSMELCQNYSTMAHDFQSEISPIGNAWLYVYNQNPYSFDFHSSDNSHPNIKGSYFTACVLYTTIFQTSIFSNYYASLTFEDALFLQQTASSLFENNTLSTCNDFSSLNIQIKQNNFSVYYSQQNNTLTISSLNNTSDARVEIYNALGVKVKEVVLSNLSQYVLDVKAIKKGYYIVRVSDKENVFTYSFVR